MEEKSKFGWNQIIQRPSMFIGDTERTGLGEMLLFFLEEITALKTAEVFLVFEIFPNNKFSLRIKGIDNARFIKKLEALRNEDNLKDSVGLAVFLSLNTRISVRVNDYTSSFVLKGKEYVYKYTTSSTQQSENDIFIEYELHHGVFKNFTLEYAYLYDFAKRFCYLNPAIKITLVDRTGVDFQQNVFYSPLGIFNLLDDVIAQERYERSFVRLNIEGKYNAYSFQVGLSYTHSENAVIKTFANNKEMFLGGSLQDGVIDGVLLALKERTAKQNATVNIDRKRVKKGLFAIAAINGTNLQYRGPLKAKLGMPIIKKVVEKMVSTHLSRYLRENPVASAVLLGKFIHDGLL